jgi:hypothetical protein
MNIPFFEILVLLFFLWPLIQRFLEKNKPVDGENPHDIDGEYYDNAGPQKGDPDWQEAMRELEMIFTGERPPEPQKPVDSAELEPRDRSATQRRTDSTQHSRLDPSQGSSRRMDVDSPEAQRRGESFRHNRLDPNTVNVRRKGKEAVASQRVIRGESLSNDFVADELVDELTASSNPIYMSLDKAPEIKDERTQSDYSVFTDVRDTKRLREFFVMKEILDKPVSRRNTRNFV